MSEILYCHCKFTRILPAETRDAVLTALIESGRPFEAVPDLCEMSARKDPALADYASRPGLRIAACYPRAVQWLFSAGDAPLKSDQHKVGNMREQSADEVLATILDSPNEGPGVQS
jgi:hypothetical protein